MYLGVGFGSVAAGSGRHAVVWDDGAFDFLSGDLDNRLTLTRGSEAYFFDEEGILQLADLNDPRFGYYFNELTDTWELGGLLLDSQERTNLCLQNRTQTNAAWTKSNITAAKNVTGITGVVNSACRLTATASNGTCLQAITNAEATVTYSAFVKRITGTGKVDITLNGGTLWIDITRYLETDRWVRVCQTLQGITDPSVGFRIRTNTDVIAVDFCQLEVGSGPSSPILTTTDAVTRNPDVLTCLDHRFDWYSQTSGTTLLEWLFPDFQRGTCGLFEVSDGTADNRIYFSPIEAENNREQTLYSIVGGVQEARLHSKIPRWGHVQTAAFRYLAADFFMSIDGLIADTSNDGGNGLVPTVTGMTVGFGEFSGFVRRIENLATVRTNDETCALISRALPQRQLNTFGLGPNLSGLEFGAIPGTVNVQYFVPTEAAIEYFGDQGEGFDHIRLPFRWERIQPTLDGALNATYLGYLTSTVALAAANGMTTLLDMHNFGGYTSGGVNRKIGAVGGPTVANFVDVWEKIAAEFDDNDDVLGYDIMNEPSLGTGVAQDWYDCAQEVVTALRDGGSTKPLFIEGHGSSAATQWTDNDTALNTNMDLHVVDPDDNMVFSAHFYMDGNNSGAYAGTYDSEGATPHTGIVRLAPFLAWCGMRKRTAHIGEFNAPGRPADDDRWLVTIANAVNDMVLHGVPGSIWGGGTAWSTNYPLRLSPVNDVEQQSVTDVYENYISADITPPSKVLNLVAVPTGVTSTSLTWDAATDNIEVARYRIRRGGTLIAVVDSAVLTYVNTGLDPNTLYSYTVAAVDIGGNEGEESDPDTATTDADVTAPSTPVLTAQAAGSVLANLNWPASTDDVAVDHYNIYRDDALIDTVAAPAITFQDSGLTPGATYEYEVSAEDGAGNESARSNLVAITTTSLAPTITLSFMSSLPAGCAFTRASTARYFDSNGVLQTAAINTPRFGYYWTGSAWALGGLIMEAQSRTNRCLHSRDLTNAVWTKTDGTAAKNQTGLDGVSNSASSFTATSNNATCLQSITHGSAMRNFSVYLKRLTGTGKVDITLDGGARWIPVTAFVGTGGNWDRADYTLNASVNPVVGIRLRTSGDAVAVDFCQAENGSNGANTGGGSSTPIETTTAVVTRSPDVMTMIGAAFSDWYTQAQGSFWAEWLNIGWTRNTTGFGFQIFFQVSDGTNSNRQYFDVGSSFNGRGTSFVVVTNNVTQASNGTRLGVNIGTVRRGAATYGTNSFVQCIDGLIGRPDESGTPPVVNKIDFGISAFCGFLREFRHYAGILGADDLVDLVVPVAAGAALSPSGFELGVNLSGLEFGSNIPGTVNVDYFPVNSGDAAYIGGKGYGHIRLCFRWDRIQTTLGGALDAPYLGYLTAALDLAEANGFTVILDMHNYAQYRINGTSINIGVAGGPTPAQWAEAWGLIAAEVAGHPALSGYDIMNEPNIGAAGGTPTYVGFAQLVINAIRAEDPDTHIYVNGYGQAGGAAAWMNSTAGHSAEIDTYLEDPSDRLIYSAHSYWDSDASGVYNESYDGEDAYPDAGAIAIASFAGWCRTRRVRGHIGEFAAPGLANSDPRWLEVERRALDAMERHGLQGSAWSAGKFWSNNYFGRISPIGGVTEVPRVTDVHENYLTPP